VACSSDDGSLVESGLDMVVTLEFGDVAFAVVNVMVVSVNDAARGSLARGDS
jgi:hypothetical protein